MDYFKELVGNEKITVEHEGSVLGDNLTGVIEDYADKGYSEFKVVIESKSHVTSRVGGSNLLLKVTARGDKEAIKSQVRKWYPDLLEE